jgi:hypothetical protein
MVGGTVIEAKPMRIIAGEYPGKPVDVIRLWCVDRRCVSDECAVYADASEAGDAQPGDWIWWQGRAIYWTRHGAFVERKIRRIGFSFDPRKSG